LRRNVVSDVEAVMDRRRRR